MLVLCCAVLMAMVPVCPQEGAPEVVAARAAGPSTPAHALTPALVVALLLDVDLAAPLIIIPRSKSRYCLCVSASICEACGPAGSAALSKSTSPTCSALADSPHAYFADWPTRFSASVSVFIVMAPACFATKARPTPLGHLGTQW